MSTLNCFALLEDAVRALPLVALRTDMLDAFLANQPAATRAWVAAHAFTAAPGTAQPDSPARKRRSPKT